MKEEKENQEEEKEQQEEKEEKEEKRTGSDQRKLRSRDAARCRRSQETEVFYELARSLPLPRRVSSHLDKLAIMRASLSVLRMSRLLRRPAEEEKEEEEEEDVMDTFYPEALAGFVMVTAEDGDVIYLTENVSKHIGVTQLELLGQSLYDFVHPCDQEELRDLLTPLHPGLSRKRLAEQRSERNFFLRMKSTLTSRGRSVNLKSASWKVLHCTGHMRPFGGGSRSPPAGRVMTLLCEPLPHPSSVEFPLDSRTFLTRHSMDLRFTNCEGRVTELVGYKPDDLIGRSAYEFHHAADSDHVTQSLHTLLSKGQVNTSIYRFLANNGGFVWAETQATVLYSSKTSQPEAVVCLNFILSGVEQPDVVFSVEQIRGRSEDEELNRSAAELVIQTEEELLQVGDATALPPPTDVLELSFYSPTSPGSTTDRPEALCSPQLLQLLTPIFSTVTPPTSASPSDSSSAEMSCCGEEEEEEEEQEEQEEEEQEEEEEEEEEQEEEENTKEVMKFFTFWPEDDQEKGETMKDENGLDLEMLAPYISMDDDFQLTFLSSLPEDAVKPPTATVTASRKRTLDDTPFRLIQVQDKRQKQDVQSTIEEELLLSHRLLDRLNGTDPPHQVQDPGPGGRSHLLTDRDPLLGGMVGLCDTAALMRDIFTRRPPDLSPPLSPLT